MGRQSGNRVLLVEDDTLIFKLLEHKLTQHGFEVHRAASGEFVAEVLSKVRPDIVLLDIVLPGVDGFEILRRLKADPNLATIPVVMLSNLDDQAQIDRALELGAVGYLVKIATPPEEVVATIRKIVG